MRWLPNRRLNYVLWIVIVLNLLHAGISGAALRRLPGTSSQTLALMTPTGRPPATNEMRLALVLPLRDRDGLEAWVAQIADPASPHYRQYLDSSELTARFGPTIQDYSALENFARSNSLAIVGRHANRLVLEVSGPVTAVETTFHVTLRTYRHPTEARDFFAPDITPAVDAALPLVNVEGLSDYSRPHPRRAPRGAPGPAPKNGSSPDGNGYFFGNDFRNAYAPGTVLTGAGQSVGLFEWDGSYSNAVAAYARAAGGGRTNIIIKYVLISGFSGKPTTGSYSGEPEVDMDIELAMAMAPGLKSIVVFEGNPAVVSPIAILNTMAASNTVKNLSCSWGWSAQDEPYTNTDAVFLLMAAQGQTFCNASGDSGAFTTGPGSSNGVDNPSLYNAPSSTPYITQVGGTFLAMSGTAQSWNSEQVWDVGVDATGDHFDNSASSGGVSSYYSIPTWQTNLSHLPAWGGSTRFRNIPDVAACADHIYEVLGGRATPDDYGGGTSASAPLWAGFMALVNQQLAAQGNPSAGFINPTLYALAAGPANALCFHDVTYGSNVWTASPSLFFALTNYDLCTGLGTMTGTNLINALAPPKPMLLPPAASASGLALNWRTVPGAAYQLQATTNLKSTNWVNWGSPVTTTGTIATATDTVTNTQRFYRLLVRP